MVIMSRVVDDVMAMVVVGMVVWARAMLGVVLFWVWFWHELWPLGVGVLETMVRFVARGQGHVILWLLVGYVCLGADWSCGVGWVRLQDSSCWIPSWRLATTCSIWVITWTMGLYACGSS